MEATLHIINDTAFGITELVLMDTVRQPWPKHPVLLREWLGFSYHEQVAAVPNEIEGGLGTTIHTRKGSGRGQAAVFDKLVGPRVAAERKQLAKQMRGELEDEGRVILDLTPQEVAAIEERIQVHSDSLPEDKFLWKAPRWFRRTAVVTDASFTKDRALYLELDA